jgi:hypothetical protein
MDDECEAVGGMLGHGNRKLAPVPLLSTIYRIWLDPGSNPGRYGGKPATYRLSFGSAVTLLHYSSRCFMTEDTDKEYLRVPAIRCMSLANYRSVICMNYWLNLLRSACSVVDGNSTGQKKHFSPKNSEIHHLQKTFAAGKFSRLLSLSFANWNYACISCVLQLAQSSNTE